MVFFVCEGCNESLKKNKVDLHASRCRNCYAVSCVDCSQIFPGDEYKSHTMCISEAEKYQGKLYNPSAKNNVGNGANSKKQNPQQKWMQIVQHCAQDSSQSKQLLPLLQQIANYDNVPRKKNKFINFLSNSLGLRDAFQQEQLWEILQNAFTKMQQEEKEQQVVQNKRKREEDEKQNTPVVEETVEKKKAKKETKPPKWEKLIKKALKAEETKSLAKKKLRRTVIESIMGSSKVEGEKKQLKEEFKQHLKKMSAIEIKDGVVTYKKQK